MLYYASFRELITVIILMTFFSKLPVALSEYPIINMTTFINKYQLLQFHGDEYGNFSNFLNTKNDFFYIVSNGNEILQLQKSNLRHLAKYSMKKNCNQALCEMVQIELMKLNMENTALSFCFAHKSISNDMESGQPNCYMLHSSLSNQPIANWLAYTYVSNDFQHRSVHLYTQDYVYSGIYYLRLYIFKNPLPFGKGSQKLFLPSNILKSSGDFITSFQHDRSVYFLYLETDFVCGFKDDKMITRLIMICDSDNGNSKKEFNVFAKVDVECEKTNANKAIPPYKYRIASNGHWLSATKQLVVTFISSIEEPESSAICVYSIKSIEDAFNSDFKKVSEIPVYNKNSYPNICKYISTENPTPAQLNDFNTLFKLFPMRRQILKNETIYEETGGKFIRISSDESTWSVNRRVTLFISAEIHGQQSLLQIMFQPEFCVLKRYLFSETITMAESVTEDMRSVLYIGTSQRLLRMPLDLCNSYISQSQCSMANDPYCFWNSSSKKCSYILSEQEFLAISINLCSKISEHSLSPFPKSWNSCKLMSIFDDQKQIGTCSCNGIKSKNLNEAQISISTECKIDGDWTNFSEWSDCSVTCGVGNQIRRRTCENPRPQKGGKPCDGKDSEIRICINNINCEDRASIDPQSWSEWSSCSKTCGFSYQKRIQKCVKENCASEPTETRLCLTEPCEFFVNSEWSSWSKLIPNSMTKNRFRFQCIKKFNHDPQNMSFTYIMKNDQPLFCNGNECQSKYKDQIIDGKFSEWSDWPVCRTSCDRAEWISRYRKCFGNKCLGSTLEYKPCHMNFCLSTWSCWSSWKGCLSKCETRGFRTKTRHCFNGENVSLCTGEATGTSECPLIPCHDAYSQWSLWSQCRMGGINTRSRKCLSRNPCLLPLLQSKPCAQPIKEKPEEYSFIYMIISGLVGLIFGSLIGAILCYIWWRCTIKVIASTYSESMKISNSAMPMDMSPSLYSQSLHNIPEIYSTFRQRKNSNTDTYSKNSSPHHFLDSPVSHLPPLPSYQMGCTVVQEEHIDTVF